MLKFLYILLMCVLIVIAYVKLSKRKIGGMCLFGMAAECIIIIMNQIAHRIGMDIFLEQFFAQAVVVGMVNISLIKIDKKNKGKNKWEEMEKDCGSSDKEE